MNMQMKHCILVETKNGVNKLQDSKQQILNSGFNLN